MNAPQADKDSYRSLQLMTAVEEGGAVSQRELADRLGIAVGLVNSYLRNLAAKGFIRIKVFPRNRYAYLLTPKGVAEKGRLALQHLGYFTSLYTITRREYLDLFRRLGEGGVQEVAFCGVDEVAEIAYLSLQEAGLKLAAVFDDVAGRETLFGCPVQPLGDIVLTAQPIVITSLKRRENLGRQLQQLQCHLRVVRPG